MKDRRKVTAFLTAVLSAAAVSGLFLLHGQDPVDVPLDTDHSDCAMFGAKRDEIMKSALGAKERFERSALTEQVWRMRGDVEAAIPGGSRTDTQQRNNSLSLIDRHLFAAMQEAGVAPAPRTTDIEFIRRVTLDLTGRVPTVERLQRFAADPANDKRAKLVDELLASPEWVDKWTMYFGDLYKNTDRNAQVVRYADGRNAFQQWIKASLAANKPYNRMVTELIAGDGTNSYEASQGNINWLVGGIVTGGPQQDIYDSQAALAAETFLGVSHMNCILCHNGRGHLETLSVWGKNAVRVDAWGMSAYFAKTVMNRTPVNGAVNNQPYYWNVRDNPAARDYQLNTTTGNRPARCANNQRPNDRGVCVATGTATPAYMFSGEKPAAGQPYRTVLARQVTGDFQFARAAVNYVWAELFSRGIVDPPNQFDPARLDPDNPPEAPWTLQPSNPRLLNALAQEFINSGYDLKALMRQIVNSNAYQLSSRYEGSWNPQWERLFARKLARRLWGEEIHDAVVQSSNVMPSYNLGALGRTAWAMQFPEPRGFPDGQAGRVSMFLDSFLRGNREDEDRRGDGSVLQALNMMNDNFVMSRVSPAGNPPAGSLLQRGLAMGDEAMVELFYLSVLSRYPSDAERTAALANLQSGTRRQRAENLLWTLYNKVDFLFNY